MVLRCGVGGCSFKSGCQSVRLVTLPFCGGEGPLVIPGGDFFVWVVDVVGDGGRFFRPSVVWPAGADSCAPAVLHALMVDALSTKSICVGRSGRWLFAVDPCLEVAHEDGRWLLLGAGRFCWWPESKTTGCLWKKSGLRCNFCSFQSAFCKEPEIYCANVLLNFPFAKKKL